MSRRFGLAVPVLVPTLVPVLIPGPALVLACLLAAGPAHAQSARYAATPDDFDDQGAQHSAFWNKVVHPNQGRYRELISRASVHIKGRDPESTRQAERHLMQAAGLLPEEPLAYWMLAVLYEGEEKWRECADAYNQVALLDPLYQPTDYLPPRRGAAWALDHGQAMCHGQLGDFERAVAHYQHILTRGASHDALVYRGLGDAYMALGRLHDAISAFDMARKRDPAQWHVLYQLAVAHDRAEQEASAREMLALALQRDPHIRALETPDLLYVPASDRYYYLGLAHAMSGRTEWAIVYFRHYALLAGDGPWAHRARDHLRDLGRAPWPHADSIDASDKVLDIDLLLRAIGKAREPLHACLAETPRLLLEVRITVLGATPRDRAPRPGSARTPPTPGVKAKKLYAFETPDEQIDRAIECVEARTQTIDIPRVRGDTAQYRTITFRLTAWP